MEQLFEIDSDRIIELLHAIGDMDPAEKEPIRWKISLLLIDDIISTFGYEGAEKSTLITGLAESFRNEFNFKTNNYTKQPNDKYRNFRNDISELNRYGLYTGKL